MKIQIDTTEKIIKIEEKVNINDLMEMIKKLLPNDEWKNYSIEVITIQNWNNPYYIKDWCYPTYSPNPYSPPFYMSCGPTGANILTPAY